MIVHLVAHLPNIAKTVFLKTPQTEGFDQNPNTYRIYLLNRSDPTELLVLAINPQLNNLSVLIHLDRNLHRPATNLAILDK